MTTWVAIAAVGVVSYMFRVAPLLVLGRVRISDRVDRAVRHAGAAAMTALLVGALQHGGGSGSSAAVLAATATGLVVAARGAPMLRVVLAGGVVYATIAIMETLPW